MNFISNAFNSVSNIMTNNPLTSSIMNNIPVLGSGGGSSVISSLT